VRILFVLRQKKNLDAFVGVMRELLQRGHEVRLAVQERDGARDGGVAGLLESPRFSIVTCPAARGDDWSDVAPLVRGLRDYLRYLTPQLENATKLRGRALHKLYQELALRPDVEHGFAALSSLVAARLDAAMSLSEAALPTDPLHLEFLKAQSPDALLLSPVVHFGSAQADYVRAARALGIPVGMLLFSWDNLSTKGCLHVPPDVMFVWNELQRREAADLHGFPPDAVRVTGAPRFDDFFGLQVATNRSEFFEPLGLDAAQPTVLYLCSSRFVSEGELGFIRSWIQQLRESPHPSLRQCNVIVRPHPDVPLLGNDAAMTSVRWPALRGAMGYVAAPFDDPAALVLRTAYGQQQTFYDCIFHSTAVVGLNTSAELEAGIVGRPVLTIVADDERVSGQKGTLHFHYLLEEQGGFVSTGHGFAEHFEQLASAIGGGDRIERIHGFINEFLRPAGAERPVSAVLAEAIEREFSGWTLEGASDRAAAANVTPARSFGRRLAADESKAEQILRVGYEACSIHLHATPETKKGTRKGVHRLDPAIVQWLEQYVAPGEVMFDVGAGVGVYSLVAARRGAVVVSFEPGFSTYERLCRNVLLNRCDGQIVPVPLQLADRDGLASLKYPRGRVGADTHSIKEDRWRGRPPAADGQYVQPALVLRLDSAVGHHELPLPRHLRIASPHDCVRVLRGATSTLAGGTLGSLLVTVTASERKEVDEILAANGFEMQGEEAMHHGIHRLLLTSPPASERPAGFLVP